MLNCHREKKSFKLLVVTGNRKNGGNDSHSESEQHKWDANRRWLRIGTLFVMTATDRLSGIFRWRCKVHSTCVGYKCCGTAKSSWRWSGWRRHTRAGVWKFRVFAHSRLWGYARTHGWDVWRSNERRNMQSELQISLQFRFDYSRAPNGPRKGYDRLDSSEVQSQGPAMAQHRQEREAQDYAVSESNETEEEPSM